MNLARSFNLSVLGAALWIGVIELALAQGAPRPAAAAAGTAGVSACIGCHAIPGYQSSFPQVYRVPMISGQSAKYIEAALGAYKRGERNHPTMTAVAKGLSDRQIQEVAVYFSALGSAAAP
jgi:cytochrome c553